jgi:putative membrane protein
VNASFGLFGLLLAQPVEGWGHAWGGGPPGFFPFFPLIPLFWVVALGLVAWVMMRGIRPRDRAGGERAREILAERYARGEISSDEYRERLEHLAATSR